MKICLDTNIIIDLFQSGNSKTTKKLFNLDLESICTTSITASELFYGAYKSAKVNENLDLIEDFLSQINVYNYDNNSAKIFGEIKKKLGDKGNTIEDLDAMIASIAISNKLTLFTQNTKHFQRIKSLKLLRI